jgi:hypothetical protein
MRPFRRRARRIAVLVHERTEPARLDHYAIRYLADLWREDGLEVEFLFGVARRVPADLLLVHVDLSVVPDEYLEFAHRYPIVLNGRARDIRKSSFSTLRLDRDSDYEGPVIVKSDLNYAGVPERLLEPAAGPRANFADSSEYRVYDALVDVPSHELDDPDLVVERFVPEVEDGLYRVRMFDVLGDRCTSVRHASEHPISGASTLVGYDFVEPPPELWRIRERLGLDYGKIDYVLRDGRPLVIDVNKTTGASNHTDPVALRAMRRERANGIYAYLR